MAVGTRETAGASVVHRSSKQAGLWARNAAQPKVNGPSSGPRPASSMPATMCGVKGARCAGAKSPSSSGVLRRATGQLFKRASGNGSRRSRQRHSITSAKVPTTSDTSWEVEIELPNHSPRTESPRNISTPKRSTL